MAPTSPLLLTLVATACLLSCAPLWAADEAILRSSIELNLSRDHLSNGSPDWSEHDIHLRHQLPSLQQIDLDLRQVRRFGLRDTQLELNYFRPLSKELSVLLNGSYSEQHQVLAHRQLTATLQYTLAERWFLHAGAKQIHYSEVKAQQLNFALEHYVAAFRWQLGWHPMRVAGVHAQSADLRLDYYYRDHSWFGLQWSGGEETANVGGRGLPVLQIYQVRSVALSGRHRLNPQWSLRYAFEKSRQGHFYDKTGVNLGVQYNF
jgi:YaiO family outer membrane protein